MAKHKHIPFVVLGAHDKMIKDKLPEQDKKAVQDLMAFKVRYKDGK